MRTRIEVSTKVGLAHNHFGFVRARRTRDHL